MPNDETPHHTELPKLVDDGVNNNYGEWETKSYHKLDEWDLLKYIEGPSSEPPVIPPLRETVSHQGIDDAGNVGTFHILGNANEHQQALTDAEPWLTGNKSALARIIAAVPASQLHLVKRAKYAKRAWEALRSVYQPRNSLRASTIKGQIMAYRCQSDMDVAKWLNDMQRLYNSLCDLDPDSMTDRDFAHAILDLMSQDETWRDFVSGMRTKVRDAETQGSTMDSATLTTTMREEYWYRHKDDYQTSSHVFSVRLDAQRRSSSQKRPRPAAEQSATAPSSSSPTKRARTLNPERAKRLCTNPECDMPRGHELADCVSYKGGKEGKYGDWWRGPWNIHLPHPQRTKDNNVPPKSHPAYTRLYGPSVNQSVVPPTDQLTQRSSTARIESLDDSAHVNTTLSNDASSQYHVWSTQLDNHIVLTTLPILNLALPLDNSCHHDSGANRHVFHDRTVFEHYEHIKPLTVKGFGKNLSTVAIGQGSVRLEGRYRNRTCDILLENVLHIPAARSNLISGIQLDKAGVTSALGNNTIFLSANDQIIVDGAITNDMYKLNVRVLPPKPASLISRLAPPPLLSRLGPSLSTSHADPPGFYTA
jgi:hypothetical protein